MTCPVALFKAVEPATGISFNLISPKTNSRVKQVLKDASTGEPVDRGDLVKGYAVEKDEYILIEPEELDALKVESTKIIDIERFVDGAAIDRIYWDEPYFLVPDGKTGIEAFAVIREAMGEQDKVGLGRVVLANRERMIAIEPRDGMLLVTTLRARDEVRDIDAMPGAHAAPKASREMLEIAGKIIDQNAGEFEPEEFVDRYEDAVRKLVEQKRKGYKPVRAEKGDGHRNAEVIDLMKMLRESISGGGKRANDNAPRAAAARRAAPTKAGPKPGKRGRHDRPRQLFARCSRL